MNRRTTLIGAAAALAVLVLWFLLLWSPQRSKINDARDRARRAELQQANLRLTLSRLQDLGRREPVVRSQLERLRVAIPDQPNLGQFIIDANEAATQAGIDFLSISPALPTQSQTGGPPQIGVAMNVKGGYFQVLDYLNRLDDLPRLVVIDSLAVTPEDNGAVLLVTIQGRMFVTTVPVAAGAAGATTTTTVPGSPTTTTPGAP